MDRFDRIAIGVIGGLVLGIGVAVARGDQVGVSVRKLSPLDTGSSRAVVQATFDEAIDGSTLSRYFSIDPQVAGNLTAADQIVTFRPTSALAAGVTYHVKLNAGLSAKSGRHLKQDVVWQFTIRQPQVVYLAPAGQPIQNLFVVDPSGAGQPRQLTHSVDGILDYDVLPDGSKIVYAEMEAAAGRGNETTTLYSLDLMTDAAQPLYSCRAVCLALAWRPDGGAIAFQRVDLGDTTGFSQGAPRIWLYDFASNTGHPLLKDDQILGSTPRWSPDGSRLAFFSASEGAILVDEVASGNYVSIPTNMDQAGPISPDGRWLAFPRQVTFADGSAGLHLALADLSKGQPVVRDIHDLTPPAEVNNDMEALWRSDSRALIVPKQPASRGLTDGMSLYTVDMATGKSRMLVPDGSNNQINLSLSPAGDTLLFERVALAQADAKSSVWIDNLTTKALTRLVDNATLPAWLP